MFGGVTTAAMEYGKSNEETVITKLQKIFKIEIKKCGIFINKEHPYLGATPDGLISNNGIVEV